MRSQGPYEQVFQKGLNWNNKVSHPGSQSTFALLPPDQCTTDPPSEPQPYRLLSSSRKHRNPSFAILTDSYNVDLCPRADSPIIKEKGSNFLHNEPKANVVSNKLIHRRKSPGTENKNDKPENSNIVDLKSDLCEGSLLTRQAIRSQNTTELRARLTRRASVTKKQKYRDISTKNKDTYTRFSHLKSKTLIVKPKNPDSDTKRTELQKRKVPAAVVGQQIIHELSGKEANNHIQHLSIERSLNRNETKIISEHGSDKQAKNYNVDSYIPKQSKTVPEKGEATAKISASKDTRIDIIFVESNIDSTEVHEYRETSTQLKIEHISPIVDGRVLSATSITNAINKMNKDAINKQIVQEKSDLDKNLSDLSNSTIVGIDEPKQKFENTENSNGWKDNNIGDSFTHDRSDTLRAGDLETLIHDTRKRGLFYKNSDPVALSIIEPHVDTSESKTINLSVNEKPFNIEVQSDNQQYALSNGFYKELRAHDTQLFTNEADQLTMERQPEKSSIGTKISSTCNKIYSFCPCTKSCCTSKENNSFLGRRLITSNLIPDCKAKAKTCWNNMKCARGVSLLHCFSNKDDRTSRPSILGKFRCGSFIRRFQYSKVFPTKNSTRKSIRTDNRKVSIKDKKKSSTPSVNAEDHAPNIDLTLVEHTSPMKAALPVLPICLAWFCLICNCVLPGSGTIFSGCLCLCIGKPRFSQYDTAKLRIGAWIINLFIGCGQFFTVLFCLVGWGWSIWWGLILVKISRKHDKLSLRESTIKERSLKPNNTIKKKQYSKNIERRSQIIS